MTSAYPSPPQVSVVVPCFNEEETIAEFCRRMTAACEAAAGGDFEIVLVDDGSRDGTWPAIETLAAADPRLVGVRLFRNHGHQLAVTAGLSVATGARVMLIDADLQDPPELLGEMMARMDDGADVVYGRRISREGESWFKTWTAAKFYRALDRLSSVPIPRDTGDFRLMTRRVADILAAMPERHRFIRGMVSWIGGRQVELPYERQARFAGVTKYPLRKMIAFALDAITSFSTKPLRIASWLGAAVSAMAFGLLAYTLIVWLSGDAIPGWASSLTASSLFAGTQLLVLGIMGEYIGRIVDEVKRRPLFIIGAVRRGGIDMPLHGAGEPSYDAAIAELRRLHAASGAAVTPPPSRKAS